MQILQAFAIHDVKANAFITPFFFPTKAMAVRVFAECINDPQHQFGRHPADYTLFHLGTFDTDSGTLKTLDRGIEVMHVGITLRKQERDEAQLQLIKNDKQSA